MGGHFQSVQSSEKLPTAPSALQTLIMQALLRVPLRGILYLPVQSMQVFAKNMRSAPSFATSCGSRSMSTGRGSAASSFDQLINNLQATRDRKDALGTLVSTVASAGERSKEEAGSDSSSSSSDDEDGSSSDSDSDSGSDSESLHTKEPQSDEFTRSYGTGRRKTGVARVWIKEGSGQIQINDKV